MSDSESTEFGLTSEKVGNVERLTGRFRDLDELSAAAADWDLDFVQLEAGSSPSDLTQVLTPGLAIQRFRFGRSYLQRGASSPTMRTFGFLAPDVQNVRMFGKDLTASDMAIFRTGGEFESLSPPGFEGLSISIDAALLEESFEAVGMSLDSDCTAVGSGLLRGDPGILQRVRRRATLILDEMDDRRDVPARSELLEELNFQLPIDLALAIQSADGEPRQADSRTRDFAFRRAVSFINDHPDESISVRGLCQEVGVGWTTLVQAFREHFGVTPKAYIRAVRLHGARRGLLEATSEELVADVANRRGFWHMGQFAADYKRLFGELPSDSKERGLARGSGGSSSRARAERRHSCP